MPTRWRLFPKYALLIIALVTGMLLASGAVGIWFYYRENQDHLIALAVEEAADTDRTVTVAPPIWR